MKKEEILPIGTVVKLKGGKKRLMIHGIKQTQVETGEEFDYAAVLYPEGNLGKEFQYLFNQGNIEKVEFRGYEDEEREQFINNIERFYDTQD